MQIIDLAAASFNVLYEVYDDSHVDAVRRTFNLMQGSGDLVHSSYAGAMMWASLVAQGLKDLGYDEIVNTEFQYTFTDTLGNVFTAEVA